VLDKARIDSRFVGFVMAYQARRWLAVTKAVQFGLGRKTVVPFLLPNNDLSHFYYDLQLREEANRVSGEIYEQVTFMQLEIKRLLAELAAGKETMPQDEKAQLLITALDMKKEMDGLVATLEELNR
jgi:hypothetical protein